MRMSGKTFRHAKVCKERACRKIRNVTSRRYKVLAVAQPAGFYPGGMGRELEVVDSLAFPADSAIFTVLYDYTMFCQFFADSIGRSEVPGSPGSVTVGNQFVNVGIA
jgi:hypothetical protein